MNGLIKITHLCKQSFAFGKKLFPITLIKRLKPRQYNTEGFQFKVCYDYVLKPLQKSLTQQFRAST